MREKHVVKRAIILAAGIGSRMHPLTLEVPKPLIKVNGTRMIDTIVDGLQTNGINEIYVVIGYLKEQFIDWAKDKKGIKLIENPYYCTCNNISSLYVARQYLGECIIVDGDQVIYNKSALSPFFDLSGYNAVWCEGKTSEWLMDVENGIVKNCSRTGGSKGWQLYSVSRWTKEDGVKLRSHIEYEFERGNRYIYWDDVVMFLHFGDYQLGMKEMKAHDVIEIDGVNELMEADHTYQLGLQTIKEGLYK